MMLESCNFPLLVNSVTPLKKNYRQQGFLLTSSLFGFVAVGSVVAIVKVTYLSTIKLCKAPFKHQKSSGVSWSHSSA